MVLLGRVLFNSVPKTILHYDGQNYSVAELLSLTEEEVLASYYDIIYNKESLLTPQESALIKIPPDGYCIPIPLITTLRDFFAFEEHVRNARSLRGEGVPQEWYQLPVFYYSNHTSVIANGEKLPYPKYTKQLDYEMELAFVIGKEGRNITADDYEEYVAGVTIANDWSARDVQRIETRVGLGPAKGKDFATSIGPYLLTRSDLRKLRTERGKYDIELSAYVNGSQYGKSNMKAIHFDLGMIIERASDEVTLHRGDVIMTGTFGNGTILEMMKSGVDWLHRGDKVSIQADAIGSLDNEVM